MYLAPVFYLLLYKEDLGSMATSDTITSLSSNNSTASLPGSLSVQTTGEMLFGDEPVPPPAGNTGQGTSNADDLFGSQPNDDFGGQAVTSEPLTSQNTTMDIVEVNAPLA